MLRAAETTSRTDTGRQRRGNEDSSYVRPPLFVVADGMGGAQAGEVASSLAVEAFTHGLGEEGNPEERLAERVQEANRRIYDRSRREHEQAGMGTTLTAAYLDGDRLAIAHVGDSRAYLLREGSLKRLTQDHSLVDELVRRGKLTEAQAAEHPQRSIITRALGPEPEVEVDTWSYPVRGGDLLLLCSDGLTSMISEERITEILSAGGKLDAAAQRLIDEANEAGGRDNITVVLFRVEEVGQGAAREEATMVGVPAVAGPDGRASRSAPGTAEEPVPVAPPPQFTGAAAAAATTETGARARVPLARTQGARPADGATPRRRRGRYGKLVAALIALICVLALVIGGGYVASRQLYFIGTNAQGVVTVYRGLPYDLPFGIRLYETYYVSGVSALSVPSDRRSGLFDHRLRSQNDATSLIRTVELGQLSR